EENSIMSSPLSSPLPSSPILSYDKTMKPTDITCFDEIENSELLMLAEDVTSNESSTHTT
ncbi:4770_t:CDS:1, partial [Dentiscutata heterogama]